MNRVEGGGILFWGPILGIPALAVGEYEQALQADTASTEVYYHWAEACLEMKDYSCAIEGCSFLRLCWHWLRAHLCCGIATASTVCAIAAGSKISTSLAEKKPT